MKYIKIFAALAVLSIMLFACMNIPQESFEILAFNEACIKPDKRFTYKTCEPLYLEINGKEIVVPGDFKTDLASIPRPFWSLISPMDSRFMAPAILHDYMYQCPDYFTRREADSIFYQNLRLHGVGSYTAYKMYLAVRLFGFRNFQDGNFCIYRDTN